MILSTYTISGDQRMVPTLSVGTKGEYLHLQWDQRMVPTLSVGIKGWFVHY